MDRDLHQLGKALSGAMRRDRPRLARMLRWVREAQQQGRRTDRNLDRLIRAMDQSVQRRHRRNKVQINLDIPTDLPIRQHRDAILAALRRHQVIVVAGETGSGKSTQLPKLLIEAGFAGEAVIGHTQPRRIAARSLADRLAQETGTTPGSVIGYKVRFSDHTGPDTLVKFMTDGILLAETQTDRLLLAYDAIILDEAHERSLNIDFLLGYLRQLLPRRPEMRLVITSATIDVERFARHFATIDGPAPIIQVSGRNYPVEIHYRPLDTDEDHDGVEGEQDNALLRAIRQVIDEAASIDRGDMLVFLPTERAIAAVARMLRTHRLAGDHSAHQTVVLPLYARLPTAQQQLVFNPGPQRRIVLATNVAESSLTVPRIRFVIDTGTARISRYSTRSRLQRLPIEAISQASADQRAGRCGRVGPGICFRLYNEQDLRGRDPFTTPEILRTSLASVILQMKSLRLGAVEAFGFIEPPKPRMVREGYRTLHELEAVDDKRELTEIGRKLAKLPLDPRLGRVILAGDRENCLAEVLVIASALECQDPRLRPPDQEKQADESHARFRVPGSDFLAYLKMWDFYHHLKQTLSQNKLRKACMANFLSYTRCREWAEIHRQLEDLAKDAGMVRRERRDDAAAIHRAMLTGLLSNIAMRGERHEYRGADGSTLYLWPGSSLFGDKPAWIVAAEVVETERVYARVAAKIDPKDIEPLAQHLVKRSHSEPHWDRKSGQAMAWEKVTLLGLPIVPRRRVPLGRYDRAAARSMFIEMALVEEEWDSTAPFFRHNHKVRRHVADLVAQRRDPNLKLDPRRLLDFYDRRVPAEVHSAATFERWRRQTEREQPRLLHLREADLLPAAESSMDQQVQFPRQIEVSGERLRLDYVFAPGAEDDGLTVTTPVGGLRELDSCQLQWLVPGRLEELVTALIRAMAMPLRRSFVPAPQTAQRILPRLRFGEGSLLDQLARVLSDDARVEVSPQVFDLSKLEPHLRMNIRVIDDAGRTLAHGRDLAVIRQKLRERIDRAITGRQDTPWHRDNVTRWDFGELPASVSVAAAGGMKITAYPALVDQGDMAALRLLGTAGEASVATRDGVRRLVLLEIGGAIRSHIRHVASGLERMKLRWKALRQGQELEPQLLELICRRAIPGDAVLPRNREAFSELADAAWNRIAVASDEVWAVVPPLLERASELAAVLEQEPPTPWYVSVMDLREQWDRLLSERFLLTTPWPWLTQLPRYVEGMRQRWQRLEEGGLSRDAGWLDQVAPRWRTCWEAKPAAGKPSVEWSRYRWMLEEWRVALFAQSLGTATRVSPKRLDEQWQRVLAEASSHHVAPAR